MVQAFGFLCSSRAVRITALQRLIDLRKTKEAGKIVLWEGEA